MRISNHDVDVAEYIVDTSGVLDVLVSMMRTTGRGRPQNVNAVRVLLVGLFLCVHHHRTGKLTQVNQVLTNGISVEAQLRLGVVVRDDSVPEGHRPVVDLNTLKYVSRVFGKKLGVSGPGDPKHAARVEALQMVADKVMDVFDLGFSTDSFALDATAIWSWGRGYCVSKDPDPDPSEMDRVRRKPHDPNAAWGMKTGKDGKPQPFYGYEEHTLHSVPGQRQKPDEEPSLIRRFTVRPAAVDVVEPSLELVDRAGTKVKYLMVDRHYSYKDPTRWWDQLHARDVRQVHDLRSDEHGFTEVDRMRFAAGHCHCPATPDSLAEIRRPAPGSTDDTEEKWDEFHRQIAARKAYAMGRTSLPDRTGKHRVQCPALAGSISCPLRPQTGSTATKTGMPVVADPPDPDSPEGLPPCCTQSTVTVCPPGTLRKQIQRDYWGDERWTSKWNKRTYVEGSYGNRKNSSTEDLRRGHFAVVGLHWVTLMMTMVNASYNLRMLRNWHERTGRGDSGHPLLAQAPPSFLVELNPADTGKHVKKVRAA